MTSPTEASASVEDLSENEQSVYGLFEELHQSSFKFRIVVVGNGAILETTHALGPTLKLNASPKTGEYLLTMASEDQSFEFHVKTSQVGSVALAEKQKGPDVSGGSLRIIRLGNKEKGPLCSLILGDSSDDAVEWFGTMQTKYGEGLTF